MLMAGLTSSFKMLLAIFSKSRSQVLNSLSQWNEMISFANCARLKGLSAPEKVKEKNAQQLHLKESSFPSFFFTSDYDSKCARHDGRVVFDRHNHRRRSDRKRCGLRRVVRKSDTAICLANHLRRIEIHPGKGFTRLRPNCDVIRANYHEWRSSNW